jgi:cellulose synthase/poly-beta-1,6-N-acetylglucosamine synthase-like glycosyltransferase
MSKYQPIIDLVKQPLVNEKDTKMVEIVMLKFRDPEVEKRCVSQIIQNTDHPFKLTVYDNRVNGKNISKIWNKLIKESTCDYICILDSDAFVPKGWLTKMMDSMNRTDVVVPLITETTCNQQKASEPGEGEEPLNEIFAAQCVLYRKSVFDRMGYFNEDYLLYGQDSEWGYKLLFSEQRAILRKDVLVEHLGSYSISKTLKEFPALLEREYAHHLFSKVSGKLDSKNNLINKLC